MKIKDIRGLLPEKITTERSPDARNGWNDAIDEMGRRELFDFLEVDEEKLAAHYHDKQWSRWIKYLFSKLEGHRHIPKWAWERWARQANTLYKDLPEEEKESDRLEARAITAAIPEIVRGKK